MNLTAGSQSRIAEPFQVGQVVGIGKKTGLAIVTTLDDVQGNAIKVNAGATRHGGDFRFKSSLAPLFIRNVRHGLCGDLGFSEGDRTENIRRIGEMTKLFAEAGGITLAAFISPFRADRRRVRQLLAPEDFVELYCHCSLAVCEDRDVKGMYRRARAGEIRNFTGISSPYEEPENAELVVDTGQLPLDQCVDQVITYLHARGVLPPP